MKLNIDKDKTTNPVYKLFFIKSNLDTVTERTPWRNSTSCNSFTFINAINKRADDICNKLVEVFSIEEKVVFQEKFKMAISGDGQELKRIAVLHSSSLAALLMFYLVSKKNPLKCNIDGEDYNFTDSFFEVKTRVKKDHFSNMDVVLVGKKENKDVIFFLECKFSEYLNTGMCNGISLETYEEIYKKLGLLPDTGRITDLTFEKGVKNGTECLQIKQEGNACYCNGIKQMISHFIGVSDFAQKGQEAMDPRQNEFEFYSKLPKLWETGADVLLGEVLFSFDDTDNEVDKRDKNGKNKLEKYRKIYSDLAKVLKEHSCSNRMKVLPEILTYQELLKNYKLDTKVKQFYQLP